MAIHEFTLGYLFESGADLIYLFILKPGYAAEIEDALGMIRDRFPEKKFPFLSLQQVNQLKLIPCASAISFLPPNNKVPFYILVLALAIG